MNAEWILTELQKLPDDRKLTMRGTDAWICCPNPEHAGGQENTPSAKINLDETSSYIGHFFCFGCGMSLSWNKFAKSMRLSSFDTEYTGMGQRRLGFRRKKQEEARNREEKWTPTTFIWPKTQEWRGIPGRYLTRIGAYVPKTKDALTEPLLILPVTMWDEEVGTVRALLRDARRDSRGKKLETAYRNSHGGWVPRSLFGYDRSRKSRYDGRPLWLVEGPRDVFKGQMARLRINGLLGSAFTEERAELIRILNPPVILAATDPDDAGDKAARLITELCHSFAPVVRVRFRDGTDMFDQSIEALKKYDAKMMKRWSK